MASRLDHPTMSTETQRARALELARAAERRRRATEAHGDQAGRRRPNRAVTAGLSSLIARLGRGAPEDPEPCLCGHVPS
jgi:hypothetical protein